MPGTRYVAALRCRTPRRTTRPRRSWAPVSARPARTRRSVAALVIGPVGPPGSAAQHDRDRQEPEHGRQAPATRCHAADQLLVGRRGVDDDALGDAPEGRCVGRVRQWPAGLTARDRHGLRRVERGVAAQHQARPHLRGEPVESRQVRQRPLVVGSRAQPAPPVPARTLVPGVEHGAEHDHLEVVVLGRPRASLGGSAPGRWSTTSGARSTGQPSSTTVRTSEGQRAPT